MSKNAEIKISGKQCHAIQPSATVYQGKTIYSFYKSLVYDISISIQQPDTATKQKTVIANTKCFICSSFVPFEQMKTHVGKPHFK